MANEEQVKLLKQGVKEWNNWREDNPRIKPDLSGVYFSGVNLRSANLSDANLSEAHLNEVELSKAHLERAYMVGATLAGSHLVGAQLVGAHLSKVCLSEADLTESVLWVTDLREADLTDSVLCRAKLGGTVLGNIDLSETKGLDKVIHHGPSQLSIGTLQFSKGKIPLEFLRGCGLSDWEIESAKLYQPGISRQEANDILYKMFDLRMGQSIQINNLFISYSHNNAEFIDEVEKHLIGKGIRFWRDIHDAPAGRLEKIVDRAMRLNPTVLLVLSKDSVKSDWVEHEARLARELEKAMGRDVLCPIALDESWKNCKWPARLREQIMEYNILDFSKWKDKGEFGEMFRKLIDGLDLFYKEK